MYHGLTSIALMEMERIESLFEISGSEREESWSPATHAQQYTGGTSPSVAKAKKKRRKKKKAARKARRQKPQIITI